jgi:diaminopimelate epimerase
MDQSHRRAFTKLEALGNDFVLVDARHSAFPIKPDQVRRLADRRRGIGFDQLLILQAPEHEDLLASVVIYNSDGSLAEQCGNGMRAIALWLHQAGEFIHKVAVGTTGGAVQLKVGSGNSITVTLGKPDFTPAAWGQRRGESVWTETLNGQQWTVSGVSMGNPHLVITLPEAPTSHLLEQLGPSLGQHESLAAGANVNLAHVVDRGHIELMVHERGAGPTLACGSGACATAATLIKRGLVDSPVAVTQPGGTLVIHWAGNNQLVEMTGPARRVFDGVIDLQDTTGP